MAYAALIGLYLFVAALFGWWQISMDQRYGVMSGASQHWLPFAVMTLEWPIGIPLAMGAVVGGGWGRWNLPAPPEGGK